MPIFLVPYIPLTETFKEDKNKAQIRKMERLFLLKEVDKLSKYIKRKHENIAADIAKRGHGIYPKHFAVDEIYLDIKIDLYKRKTK